MAKDENRLAEYFILGLVIIIAAAVLFGLFQDQDLAFGRRALSGLAKGEVVIGNAIDWPHFKAAGVDIGAGYTKLPNDIEKAYYRKAFILNFALSFQGAGGRLSNFSNWHVQNRDSQKAVVAADSLGNKTILFTIVRINGKRKVVDIRWRQ